MRKTEFELAMAKVIATAKGLTADHRNPDKLRSFKSSVLWWLRELATSLDLTRGTYDIRYDNNAGTLQTEQYSVTVDLGSVLQDGQGVQYRICKSRTDYVGREPQWFSPLTNNVIAFPSVLEALTLGVEGAQEVLCGEEVLQGS